MRVLLDHCVPRTFRRLLVGHTVKTTYEMGWWTISNGRLLRAAASEFDAFITVDQNVEFQHNPATLPLPVAILAAKDNRLETLAQFAPRLLSWLSNLKPGITRFHTDSL